MASLCLSSWTCKRASRPPGRAVLRASEATRAEQVSAQREVGKRASAPPTSSTPRSGAGAATSEPVRSPGPRESQTEARRTASAWTWAADISCAWIPLSGQDRRRDSSRGRFGSQQKGAVRRRIPSLPLYGSRVVRVGQTPLRDPGVGSDWSKPATITLTRLPE